MKITSTRFGKKSINVHKKRGKTTAFKSKSVKLKQNRNVQDNLPAQNPKVEKFSKNKVAKRTKSMLKRKQSEVAGSKDESDQILNAAVKSENESNPFKEELEEQNSDSESVDNYEDEIEAHKKSLEKLKDTDPEFYKFLQENDKKLLDFDVSDNEAEENGDDTIEDIHKPTSNLEVASDESDFEPEDDTGQERQEDKHTITLKMLKNWQIKLQTDKSNNTIRCIIQAFHAALVRVSGQNEDEDAPVYKVEGSSVFNAVIQLCVLELGPAVRRFLGLDCTKLPPHKCKKFVKVKSLLRGYFTDLLKLLGGVTSSNILIVLLKHLHYMSAMIVSFPNVTKPMIKRLVQLWGTSEETVRVVAFLCILRIVSNQQTSLLDTTLKNMYMTYVKNSKFVSVNTLPGINFMRRSLVEMFSLDLNTAYQQVFLYIRQLAIHLRNAITMHKKEHIQAVYNWQYVNSLRLWGNLLSVMYNKPQLQPLLYPFVQICLGTIKLVPTAQYYPLRFHVAQILIELSKQTGVFIPLMPFLLEVLQTYNFNKKHTKVSMKPLQFTCILRLSKSQLSENGFKDAVIEMIYGQLLEYLASQSHSIAFPDLSLFCIIQIKKFLKVCHITNYCKKMRQLLEKIQQNSQFIENERKTVSFSLTDTKEIEAWETTIRNKGTPLSTYYESWNKIRNIKKNKQATENEKIGDYNLPTIKKHKKDKSNEDKGAPNPFPSDSESEKEFNFGDSEDEVQENKKSKRGTRGGKKAVKKVVPSNVSNEVDNNEHGDEEDVIEDIKLSDW